MCIFSAKFYLNLCVLNVRIREFVLGCWVFVYVPAFWTSELNDLQHFSEKNLRMFAFCEANHAVGPMFLLGPTRARETVRNCEHVAASKVVL